MDYVNSNNLSKKILTDKQVNNNMNLFFSFEYNIESEENKYLIYIIVSKYKDVYYAAYEFKIINYEDIKKFERFNNFRFEVEEICKEEEVIDNLKIFLKLIDNLKRGIFQVGSHLVLKGYINGIRQNCMRKQQKHE